MRPLARRFPLPGAGPSLVLLTLPLLGACSLLEDLVSNFDGDLETRSWSVTSDEGGHAIAEIEISGQESFQLTGSSGALLAVERLTGPNGNTLATWEDWTGSEMLTGAFWIEGNDTVFDWPIRPEDGQLNEGIYTVDIATIDDEYYYAGGKNVDLVAKIKQDGDLADGVLKARIVYCQGLGGDATVTGGVEGAVTRWNEIWGMYGLAVEVGYEESSLDPDLLFPGEDPDHVTAAEGADGSEVTVLIGETVGGSMDYYGVAGGVPGSLALTERSLVVISWLANAGGDGQFSSDDTRLFGETLAHEVGHYMGLFHPVEIDWEYWDALSDTPSCNNASACEDDLGDNLMFPYPVCSGLSCIAQDELTDSQQGIKHRYAGTL